jgi:hypothetical protein
VPCLVLKSGFGQCLSGKVQGCCGLFDHFGGCWEFWVMF